MVTPRKPRSTVEFQMTANGATHISTPASAATWRLLTRRRAIRQVRMAATNDNRSGVSLTMSALWPKTPNRAAVT